MRKPRVKVDTNTVRCPHCREENPRPAPGPVKMQCAYCGLAFELKFCAWCGKWENEDHAMCMFRAKGAAVGGDCKLRGNSKHYRDMQKASVRARHRKKAKPEAQAEPDIAEGL